MKLHERMQTYERSDRHYLTRRVPVIIRVDGRAFHTFTRGIAAFMEAMVQAAEKVMMEMPGYPDPVTVRRLTRDETVLAVYNDMERTLEYALEGYNARNDSE